jgi:hypothetical protein
MSQGDNEFQRLFEGASAPITHSQEKIDLRSDAIRCIFLSGGSPKNLFRIKESPLLMEGSGLAEVEHNACGKRMRVV